ncbi:MAG: DMT family transporter, partial [Proteobacteria bacterium]|nr:DMT family transporter [Pseudomonadota bacterium]
WADYGAVQIRFFRNTVSLAIMLPVVAAIGWSRMRSRYTRLHVVRNVIHLAASLGWYQGIAVLPLAQVFAIEFTAPFWVALMAVILLGERMNRGRATALIFGLAGMLIILRPGFSEFNIGSLYVLGAAVGFAGTHIATKRLTGTDTVVMVLFWMVAIQFPISAVAAVFSWSALSWGMVPWALLVGATGLSAHYCMTRALHLADATVVIPMDFMRLPLIAIVGFAVYSEGFDAFVLIGALVMFSGNYVSIRRERAAET